MHKVNTSGHLSQVASAILYSLACCMLGQQVQHEGRRSNRFNKLIRMASNGVGIELDWLKVVLVRRMLSKIRTITPTHAMAWWPVRGARSP